MIDLTGFQRDLLYVIGGLEQPNGLEVRDELETYYGDEINVGRLYPNLSELVALGLVKKGQKDGRSDEYRLSDRGQREITARYEWETQYVDPVRLDDESFSIK